MTRSNLQPGPETGHYHDTLGVDQAGGLVVKKLLGIVTWQSENIDSTGGASPGAALTDYEPPVGTTVYDVWFEVTEQWASLSQMKFQAFVVPTDTDTYSWINLWHTPPIITSADWVPSPTDAVDIVTPSADAGTALVSWAFNGGDGRWLPFTIMVPAYFSVGMDDVPTAGELRVFAIVSEPN